MGEMAGYFWLNSLFKLPFLVVCVATLILILRALNLGDQSSFLSILEFQHQNLTDYCTELGFPSKKVFSHYHAPEFRYQSHGSCHSRLEQHCYWDQSKYNVSKSFIEALRNYEKLHSFCSSKNLTDSLLNGSKSECKYLIWAPRDGLGNRLISIVGAFVYSLLTNRTLLFSPENGVSDLFCEPFPDSSLVLPKAFPLQHLRSGKRGSDFYNEMFALLNDTSFKKSNNGSISWSDLDDSRRPKSLKVVIANIPNANPQDMKFFCPAEQDMVDVVPWILWDSNNYMVPGLYFFPQYREALNRLFPDRAVFFHVARFLFSPKDEAWTQIRTFYDSYLSLADQKIGLQIRAWSGEYHPVITNHTLKCATSMNMLPHIVTNTTQQGTFSNNNGTIKNGNIAVLVSSLRVEYYNNISKTFKENSIEDGKTVSVYTASAESSQRTSSHDHNVKALMDMWLLSFMDDLVTSPRSTFGHVAHGLAGIKPAVFRGYGGPLVPEPPCLRTNIQGPCFMDHPHYLACLLDSRVGVGNSHETTPEVAHCELDTGIGITHE